MLKLKIDNPELEKELEGFEDGCRLGSLEVGTHYISDAYCAVHCASLPYRWPRIVLTPKPLPEPDWSKAGMIKSGTWVAMNSSGSWFAFSIEPKINSKWGWDCLGAVTYLYPYILDVSWLPEVPLERWKEAKWRKP